MQNFSVVSHNVWVKTTNGAKQSVSGNKNVWMCWNVSYRIFLSLRNPPLCIGNMICKHIKLNSYESLPPSHLLLPETMQSTVSDCVMKPETFGLSYCISVWWVKNTARKSEHQHSHNAGFIMRSVYHTKPVVYLKFPVILVFYWYHIYIAVIIIKFLHPLSVVKTYWWTTLGCMGFCHYHLPKHCRAQVVAYSHPSDCLPCYLRHAALWPSFLCSTIKIIK